METKDKKNWGKKLRYLWQGFLFAIVSGFLAAAVLLALLQKVPLVFAEQSVVMQTEQVSPYLTHYLAPTVHNNIQYNEPFMVVVPQKGINEIIGEEDLLGWEWPYFFGKIVISKPIVVFDCNKLSLMGKVDVLGFETVVTLCASPLIDESGLLILNLQYVRAGDVDISYLAKKTIEMVISRLLSEVEEQFWLEDILGACTENKPFEPIFPTIYGKYIKLIKSDLTESKLVLVFEPSDGKEIADKALTKDDLVSAE